MSERFFILKDPKNETIKYGGYTVHHDSFIIMDGEEYLTFDWRVCKFYHEESMDQPPDNMITQDREGLYREVDEEEFFHQLDKERAKRLLVKEENGV